jgi:UDP-3-O-[3-hydroxymyristoyl] N-acetylglucosamine deacetylase
LKHHTVRGPLQLEGVGLHSGKPSRVRVLPRTSPGLVLYGPEGAVPVGLDAVQSTDRCTRLAGVSTVEHLLAALWVAGVTAAEVWVEGEEIPAGDGSALPFWNAVQRAGLHPLQDDLPELTAREPVWVQDGDRVCAALPCSELRVTYVVRFPDRPAQAVDLRVDPASFERELAPARTWGYAEEAEDLRGRGLALGASEANTLVLERGGYRNRPRFPDEPVRHKVVDLLGDLALLGVRLRAHLVAVGAGHTTHVALAQALWASGRGRGERVPEKPV